MIFELSVGSKGSVGESYSVRIPMTLAPGQTLEVGQGICFTYEHVHIEIVPERYFYSLTAGEFPSETEAARWVHKLSAALFWINIKFRFGLTFESDVTGMNLHDEPLDIAPGSILASISESVGWRDVDGFYPADKTVIRPEHKRLICDLGGRPTVSIGVGCSGLVEALEEGLQLTNPNALADRKLRLACELYAASFYEGSSRTKFLTLMMALEALAGSESRPEPMIKVVCSFVDHLQYRKVDLVESCGEWDFEASSAVWKI